MQVVILAGGLGTRLRPITERIPKPMVEVAGRPFLEHIIDLLAAQAFPKILVLLGYLGEHVQQYFGDGSCRGVSIDYVFEPVPLGTGGAIRNAVDRLDDEFLMLFGDSYLPLDYHTVVKSFRSVPSEALMVVYDNAGQDTGVPNNVCVNSMSQVVRYNKRQTATDLNYVEAGALCFRKKTFLGLPPSQTVSLEEQIYPRLIEEHRMRAFITRQRFFDIGTQERLNEFASVLS